MLRKKLKASASKQPSNITDSYAEFVHSFANTINTIDGGNPSDRAAHRSDRVINDYARKNSFT